MVAFSITFDEEQAVALEAMSMAYADRVADMRPALRQVTTVFLEEQQKIFETRGSSGGTSWPPLTPGALAAKARKGYGEQPLVGTGMLEDSLTHRRGTKYAATYSDNDKATMGTKDPVAHLQALGTVARTQKKTGRRTGAVPARPFGFVGEQMVDRFYLVLMDWIVLGELTTGRTGGGLEPEGGLGV